MRLYKSIIVYARIILCWGRGMVRSGCCRAYLLCIVCSRACWWVVGCQMNASGRILHNLWDRPICGCWSLSRIIWSLSGNLRWGSSGRRSRYPRSCRFDRLAIWKIQFFGTWPRCQSLRRVSVMRIEQLVHPCWLVLLEGRISPYVFHFFPQPIKLCHLWLPAHQQPPKTSSKAQPSLATFWATCRRRFPCPVHDGCCNWAYW